MTEKEVIHPEDCERQEETGLNFPGQALVLLLSSREDEKPSPHRLLEWRAPLLPAETPQQGAYKPELTEGSSWPQRMTGMLSLKLET